MARHVRHRDIIEKDIHDLADIVKTAKSKYTLALKQEVTKRRQHAYASMFAPIMGKGFKPDDRERDWVLLPDNVDDDGRKNHVIVHYQDDNEEQMLDHKCFDQIERFVLGSGSDGAASQTNPPKIAQYARVWGTPIDGGKNGWTLMCWKVQLEKASSCKFDTITALVETGVEDVRWLAWVYDSTTQHSGLGVYATVSNNLILSGYYNFYTSEPHTAKNVSESEHSTTEPSAKNVSESEHSTTEPSAKDNVKRPQHNSYTLTDLKEGSTGNYKLTKNDSVNEWTIYSPLRTGLKLYISPSGVYILDSRANGFEIDLTKYPHQAWEKYMWEVVAREDPAWVFDTLLASLREEYTAASNSPHQHNLGKWRHWSYQEIATNFSGQLEYDDCGVRCVTETCRDGSTPFAFICGITPMHSFLHDRGYQWNDMKSLALHHQVAASKVCYIQDVTNKYLQNMLSVLNEKGANMPMEITNNPNASNQWAFLPITEQYFSTYMHVHFLSYRGSLGSTTSNLHNMGFNGEIQTGIRDQDYLHLLSQLNNHYINRVETKRNSKNHTFFSKFLNFFKFTDNWIELADLDDDMVNLMETAAMFMAERPYDSKAAQSGNKKARRSEGIKTYIWGTDKSYIMFVASHGFIDYDAIGGEFASVAPECLMQTNAMIEYANGHLLPQGVSVMIVDMTNQKCMWVTLDVHLKKQRGKKCMAITNRIKDSSGKYDGHLPNAVRLCPYSINQPLPFMIDTLLTQIRVDGSDSIGDKHVLQYEQWNGGRCVFITDKTDAEYAIDKEKNEMTVDLPPFYMLLVNETFPKPKLGRKRVRRHRNWRHNRRGRKQTKKDEKEDDEKEEDEKEEDEKDADMGTSTKSRLILQRAAY